MKLPDAALLIASFMTDEPVTDGPLIGADEAMNLLIDYSRGALTELAAMRILIAAHRNLRRGAAGQSTNTDENSAEEDDWVEHRNWDGRWKKP